MIVRVLGAVAAGDDESSLHEPPGLVPAAVLAHLALARGHVLTPDALADRVWDELPDNPRNALQAAVSRLRKSFSPEIVESTHAGYRLDVERITVDVVEAERLEQDARAASSAGDLGSSAELAGAALELFRGDPLAGLRSHSSDAARVDADELRLRLVGLRSEGLLATGQAAAAATVLRSTCTAAPLAEPVHGLLMRALVADGRPNDALAVYDGLRRRLADELGADPSPEVSGIFAAVLAGELEAPAPTAATAVAARARQPGTVSAPHEVGLLITDVVGSTRRWVESPELMPELMLAHHAVVAAVVAEHGGRLPPDQGEGDSRLAVFPTAAAAVAAAGSLQQALSSLDWPGGVRLSVRMGVHTGTVVEADGNVFGRTVHRCARLRALAHGDQVLVTGVAAAWAAEHLAPGCRLTRLGRAPLRDFDDDEDVFQLDWPGGPTSFPPLRTSVRLPADVASFVGRRREVPDIAHDLLDHRLVTLTGIGGSGKTRLSVQVARLASADFPGGVTFVDLSAATSAVAAYESVLAALDISAAPSSDALRGQVPANSLLVLDNLEQVLDATAFVSGVLDATSVAVLATSRAPVGVSGELVRPVAPLSDVDAVTLLRARATEAVPGLELSGPQLRRLVALLDGVPLAIELAAARLRVLDADSLADALESTLSLLADSVSGRPARHHTVDALLDDAWQRLPDTGRQVLAALAVARGAVPAGTVIDVARLDAVTALDTLQDLVARGLVTSSRRAEGAPAFTVLELVRRLALDRTPPDALAVLRGTHAAAVLDSVLRHPGAALDQSRDDVRAAMSAAAGGATPVELSPTARLALGRVALAQGWWTETIGLLEAVPSEGDALNALGVALLRRAGRGDVARGRRLLSEAVEAGDVDAACALGGSYRASDPRTAHGWYLAALALDDTDPYALGNVLEFEVRAAQSLAPVEPRRVQLGAAVRRREEQAVAGEDLPWPWCDLAKFELLLGRELVALHRLLDAVATSSHSRQLESTLASVVALTLPSSSSAWRDAAETLRIGAQVRFATSASAPVGDVIVSPVLVLVGASASTSHDEVMAWLPSLTAALDGTAGTVMSGGTAQGVSALAAALGAGLPSWRSRGFAPGVLPDGVEVDELYDDVHRTSGEGFSLLEPLACWDAISRSGLDPLDVRVLGIGGGELTHLELHLAAALGAQVAVAETVTGAPPVGRAFDGWAALPRVAPSADELRRWLVG